MEKCLWASKAEAAMYFVHFELLRANGTMLLKMWKTAEMVQIRCYKQIIIYEKINRTFKILQIVQLFSPYLLYAT